MGSERVERLPALAVGEDVRIPRRPINPKLLWIGAAFIALAGATATVDWASNHPQEINKVRDTLTGTKSLEERFPI